MSERDDDALEHSIAVIGMAARFPGARDIEEFWRNLRDGVESISFFSVDELRAAGVDPRLIEHPSFVAAGSILDGVELFDATFFDLSPREAEILDPQSRLFLECCWEALERAGYSPDDDDFTGVFAGSSASSYQEHLLRRPEVMASMGWFQVYLSNDRDYFTTRVSYKLNLKGPSINVQTACSTSLVAVHQACSSLLDYQCSMALAGGVRVACPQKTGYLFEPGGISSPDGHCRAFDAAGAGSIFGNGAGVVVLKRLEDALAAADPIAAVIRGSAINNDGSAKVGFTAPSIEGQAESIAMAQQVAGVDPETIAYVEAHGSGTELGDPIEVRALTDAFRAGTDRVGYCALGSVKSNFGHLEAAAGVAGLIKTVLALEHRQIPPSLHFETANPQIDFAATPFYVNAELRDWPAEDGPRRAGVSSFGMGGTNVHVVLEEAPERQPSGPSRPRQLLLLSARTATALETATDNLSRCLGAGEPPNLADAAYTLAVGRRGFEHRRMLVAPDAADASSVLEVRDPERVFSQRPTSADRPLAFLFPGLGEHYVDMGRGLYRREAVFRDEIDRCAGILGPHLGLDLREVLFRPGDAEESPAGTPRLDLARMLGRASGPQDDASRRLEETRYAQPAVFAVEMALARLWMSWGLEPKALIGHSLGEYAAACLAGVLALEDALFLVAERARLIHEQPPGAMLAIPLAEEELRRHLTADLGIAAVNGPEVTVAAGSPEAVADLERRLAEGGVVCRRLPTTHAFHTSMMEPVAAELADAFSRVRLAAPEIPYLSNVTGRWITGDEATDPDYWTRHMVQPVRFSAGVHELLAGGGRLLLEVGPGQGLGALVMQHPDTDGDGGPRAVLPTLRGAFEQGDDQAFALTTLGRLWLAGADVDWQGFYAGERRHRLRLPTYPFERRRFWLEAPAATAPAVGSGSAAPGADPTREADASDVLAFHARPDLPTAYAAPETALQAEIAGIWQELLGVEPIGVHDSYFDMGGHSLLAPKLLLRLERACGVALPLEALVNAPTVARLAEVVERVREDGAAALAFEAVDLAREVVLDDDILPPRDLAPRPAGREPSAVLLTGATGFLGAFLLHQLLEQTDAEVHCLARAEDEEAARRRLADNLTRFHLVHPEVSTRVVPVPGDLARPLLGLEEEAFDDLARRVDAVLHAGAWVNFTYPYRALEPTNVGGTREALRLAARGRVKPFHFVSSTAVFAPGSFDAGGRVYEDDPLEHTEGLFSGYAETKWVCEKILRLARERGIPVAIYRPGVVGGDSATGAGNTRDLVWNVIKGCIQMGACVDHLPVLDVAPADYVAAGIVYLLRQPESLGRAFHFPNPRPAAWSDAFEAIRSFGYPLASLPWPEWCGTLERLAEGDKDNALIPFLPLLLAEDADYADADTLPEGELRGQGHDGSATARALVGSGIECPPVDAELLATYFEYFVDSGFLPPPPVGVARREPAREGAPLT